MTISKPIHILFFTTLLGGGGAEKHLLRIVNNLDRQEFQISLALATPGGAYEGDLASDVKLYHLTENKGTAALLQSLIPLRQLIKTLQPDILCSVLDHVNIVAMIAVKSLPNPPKTVLSIQVPPSIHNRKSRRQVVNRTVLALIPWIYPQADRLLALSQGVAEDVKSLIPKNTPVEVIYNAGVDQEVLHKAKIPLPSEILPQDAKLIVACGRLTEQKGFTYLLEAFAQVKKFIPVRLWILGEGELQQTLETQIQQLNLKDCVELIGFKSNPFQYMAAADLFVLSSIYEGFGNVIVEAMACGTPVVASDCPHGPKEIITDGVNGLLIPPKNPQALAQAIIKVLTNPELAQQFKENGKKRAQDFDSWAIASLYGDLFAELLEKP